MPGLLNNLFSGLVPDLTALADGLRAAVPWLTAGAGVLLAAGAGSYPWWRRRVRHALRGRTAVELVPTQSFDPPLEAVERHAAHLARVPATAGWAPRRAGAVRLRVLCVDQEVRYRLEGPARAAALLRLATYAEVDVRDVADADRPEVPRIHFEGAPPLPLPTEEYDAPDGHDHDAEQEQEGDL